MAFPEGLMAFAVHYRWSLAFYAAIILAVFLLRSKFEWQGPAMGIYRTRVGLRLMERWGTKYRGLIVVLGYIGIGIGFAGMLLILWSLAQGAWRFLTDLTAPPVVTPVIPGFSIPGFGLEVPLVTGWIALFALLIIHEFSHGVLARAHRIPVKSSGLLVFGPIFGAFVEPDEKKVEREHETVNYAISAAGPFSNLLTAGIAATIMVLLIAPLTASLTVQDGVQVQTVTHDRPAGVAGLPEDAIITSLNDQPILNRSQLSAMMDEIVPGQTVRLGTDEGAYAIVAGESPDENSTKGYLGITIDDHRGAKRPGVINAALARTVLWFESFVSWFILLSVGIGLANLLPIGPLDGGRMLRLAAEQVTGDRKSGDVWWRRVTIITIVLLVGLLIFPVVRWLVL